VVLDRARAEVQPGADLRVRQAVARDRPPEQADDAGSAGDLCRRRSQTWFSGKPAFVMTFMV
jgi:hypothetical protein